MIRSVRDASLVDDPYKACVVEVTGHNHTAMLIEAKRRAAQFLKEPFVNLRASDAGNARPIERERFVAHLAVERRVILWEMTVTIKLAPEIVKSRREKLDQEGRPNASEDEE